MIRLVLIIITLNAFATDDFKNFEQPVEGMLPFFSRSDTSPTWKKDRKDILKINDHKLESQLSKEFGSEQMKGKVSVVNFFFATCTGYCPRMTSNIKRAQKDFSKNNKVNFVSYSVTPSIDTQEILRTYAEKNNINNQNWHLVRGDRDIIYKIAREQLLADLDVDLSKPKDQFAHSESVYLIDQELRVRGIYNSASKRAMEELKEDIQKILKP